MFEGLFTIRKKPVKSWQFEIQDKRCTYFHVTIVFSNHGEFKTIVNFVKITTVGKLPHQNEVAAAATGG